VWVVAALVTAACGAGIHWTSAYAAGPAADDRVLLANALAESDPPVGFTPGPRLHPVGTLARLQYETFDADGHLLDEWEVRALVPPLPERLEERGCPEECRLEEARGAAIVSSSGNPGIAAEWVLRMPKNRAFDLGTRPIVTQDLRDDTPKRVAVAFRRQDGHDIPEPARIRVTLVETCAARVRIGRVRHVEVYPDAIVPIPRGFRSRQWIQADPKSVV